MYTITQNALILRDEKTDMNAPNSKSNIIANIASTPMTRSDDSKEVAIFFAEKAMTAAQKAWARIKYDIGYAVAYVVQAFFHPIFYVAYHSLFNLTINGKEKVQNLPGPAIFIANHIGPYDSFIFDLFVPMFSKKVVPFRFMGATEFEIWYLNVLKYLGIIHLIYLLFGVFKVTYGQGAEKALRPAYDIIKNGGTVAIFPEGYIWRHPTRENPMGKFKWGAAILAKNTNAVIVPVALVKEGKGLFRAKLTVNIGDPYFADSGKTAEAITDEMREKVVAEYLK